MKHLATILLLLIPCVVQGQQWQSGPHRVDVIELFTSEGCSSCPPADRWFSKLKQAPGLFQEFIPVAFHVDYWDYIGWEDRFAKAAYSARQRRYVREGRVSQAYTPGFVVNSSEWRGWFRGERQWPKTEATVGILTADLAGTTVRVHFNGAGAGRAHVAILGMGLTSEVASGENRGRKLNHDFVVLQTVNREGNETWQIPLPDVPDLGQQRTAVVVWVSPTDSLSILQATGGYLDLTQQP